VYSVLKVFRSENGALLRDGGGEGRGGEGREGKGTFGKLFSGSKNGFKIRKWNTLRQEGACESELCKVVK
jgi:hypothetical protein